MPYFALVPVSDPGVTHELVDKGVDDGGGDRLGQHDYHDNKNLQFRQRRRLCLGGSALFIVLGVDVHGGVVTVGEGGGERRGEEGMEEKREER